MELSEKYKKTEVGLLPDDWSVKSIDEISYIRTGPFGTLLSASEYSSNDGVPLVSVGEIGAGFFKITERTPRIPEHVTRRLPQYILRDGDIVFGRKGAVDRSALVSVLEDGWFLGSDGLSIRPKTPYHSPYVAAQLQASTVRSWLIKNATGTTMPSLNQAVLGRLQIPYAPETEQRAIAAALSDIDALLSGLDRLIAKKRALKQAAMQQLLTGKTRLPGFEGEWEVRRLGELSEVRGGLAKNVSVAIQDPVSVAYLRVANVQDGHVDLSDVSFISIPRQELRRYSLRAGDVLMNEGGDLDQLGRGAVWRGQIDPCIHQNHVFAVRCGDSLLPDYLNAWTSGVQARQYFMLAGKQTTNLASISKSSLGELPVALPSVAEQQAIAAVLADMDAELEALEARREKTQVLKQGMMQELLTGRTRLV